MKNRFETAVGPGGYEYGNAHMLPDNLRNNELFQRDFWHMAKGILADSFVISSGRQYAQFCDMAGVAAVAKEKGLPVDWEILDSPLAIEAVREWELPKYHTGRPRHTDGLVEGVHEFWWRMLGDAFRSQYDDSFELPDKEALIERFEICGVPMGQTSSTTTEELSSLNEAVDDIRQTQGEGSSTLAARALQWHLLASLHWLSHKRPRTDRKDVHAVRWRDAMLEAEATPQDERSFYNHFLTEQAQSLDILLEFTPAELHAQPRLRHTRILYDKVLTLYNKKHPHNPIAALHRAELTPAAAPDTTRSLLGGFGVRAAAFE